MMAMIGRCRTATRRFSGFPAGSLPRLRFDRKIARKVLITNDFPMRGEPRKNFYPVFPVAAGRGGAILPFSSLWRVALIDLGELTAVRPITILRRFPARWRAGWADIAEARRVLMMRDPGRGSRCSGWARRVVPAGSRRRR